jgi:small multidrug resistance pump
MIYFYLLAAIVAEVAATSFLKLTDGFSRFWPSVGVLIGYSFAFYLLSLTLKSLPVSVVYAIWSGLGIVGIALIGIFFFSEELNFWHYVGIGLILAGVMILNLVTRAH